MVSCIKTKKGWMSIKEEKNNNTIVVNDQLVHVISEKV